MIALMPLALHAVPNLSSSGFSMYFKTGTVETIEPIHEIRLLMLSTMKRQLPYP
jgi:hypothetical protein